MTMSRPVIVLIISCVIFFSVQTHLYLWKYVAAFIIYKRYPLLYIWKWIIGCPWHQKAWNPRFWLNVSLLPPICLGELMQSQWRAVITCVMSEPQHICPSLAQRWSSKGVVWSVGPFQSWVHPERLEETFKKHVGCFCELKIPCKSHTLPR